jgi:hypothetical protein
MRAQEFISEISDEQLQRYLDRAGRRVDSRLERMAQARDRLNKGYEIYHAEDPTRIVHQFEADTPAEAKRYYERYNANYDSDVDYDLKLRRSTGLNEFAPSQSRDDDNEGEEDILKRYAARWYNGTLGIQKEIEYTLQMQGWSIGEIENEEGGAFVVRAGDMNGDTYIGWTAEELSQSLGENFADGKVKGKSRPGRVKRAGASCSGSITDLRKRAKNASGEKAKMYHWCANMKSGRKK